MNGKGLSIPIGMMLRNYHCAKCGAKLEKEKTHRIVTPTDTDYYQYHTVGTYPLRDYDIYGYQFQCPSCNARISFEEQCIIRRIQKKQGVTVLSPSEIKMHYKECKSNHTKWILIRNMLLPVVFSLVFTIIFYFLRTDREKADLLGAFLLFLFLTAIGITGVIRSYKGNQKLRFRRTYSYEKETQMERLHAYGSHNKQLVSVSHKCYCFYCRQSIPSSEIKEYTDNDQTAICPKCGIAALIPDSIDEAINETLISDMHEYWF